MIKKLATFLTALLVLNTVNIAKEGMWLPLLLKSLNESDMQTMGLKLSAEDIYNVNNSSLKDAVISFGGFCTGEIISDQGLILTNHHCGYGQIQFHSSVENDYLTNGYWAKELKDELKNPGLTATFIVRMEDVTAKVLDSVGVELTDEERERQIKKNIKRIGEEATDGTIYDAVIKPFFYGNEYYMYITKTYKDIRLVGAPPSSIGKFGGDEDNWMWPRHTGDFSMFRIYAGKDNEPAEYSEDNVPYEAPRALKVSTKGVQKGDFTMVYGFPGRTQQYLTSYAVDQIRNIENPAMIDIRRAILDIMDRNMRQSDEVRIKYSAKYARVSNYWKKWIGENRGLDRLNAVEVKQEQEKAFQIAAMKGDNKEYEMALPELKKLYDQLQDLALARDYFIEIAYRGLDIVSIARTFRKDITDLSAGKTFDQAHIDGLKKTVERFYKDYDKQLDKELFNQLMYKYANEAPKSFMPDVFNQINGKYKGNFTAFTDMVYKKTIFDSKEEVMALLNSYDKSAAKKLLKDPAFLVAESLWSNYLNKISPEYNRLNDEIDKWSKIYVKGMRELLPGTYYPDANSTLRLAYGQVDTYEPRDAVKYNYFTTATGILEKYDPANKDFVLPADMIDLINNKEFGDYAEDGELHVCFIASNHTTGGNSGSPVLNANGELIGLNFDRNWEGTMSDIMYDPDQCRNIAVDARYILWVVDKYAGATRLIEEMELVK
ncbi:S46 family peptidase [Acidiluteibacter ferrifornacis]|uniref:S46 family peptidase n=1 Tax=Acidiluteibacter ferrifornacis TaxID=2692424 RepID=UPI001A9735DA|nr:S46 family peptidase [Acidiluteibacter ferrifornacis]